MLHDFADASAPADVPVNFRDFLVWRRGLEPSQAELLLTNWLRTYQPLRGAPPPAGAPAEPQP